MKVAYLHNGPRPRLNLRLSAVLAGYLPGADIETLDVWEAFQGDRKSLTRALVEIVPLLARRSSGMTRKRAVIESATFGRFAQQAIGRFVEDVDADVIFQSQTLFAPPPGVVPSYVFTDHVTLVHRTYPSLSPHRPASERFVRRELEAVQRATRVFVRSENVAASVIDDYGVDRDRVRNIGIGPNLDLQDRSALGSSTGHRIVFTGRDWIRKGGPDLLEAFIRVRAEIEDAELVVVGCSPDLSAAGVSVVGSLDENSTVEVMVGADVFCLPTLREPFGVVLIEAMHLGLPVVGTNLGAQPDYILDGETGFKVEPGDRDELARVLIALLGDGDLRNRLGTAGQLLARQRYTWDAVGRGIAAEMWFWVLGPENRPSKGAPKRPSSVVWAPQSPIFGQPVARPMRVDEKSSSFVVGGPKPAE